MKIFLLIITLTLPTIGLSETVFQWKDSKGITHFSNKPIHQNKPARAEPEANGDYSIPSEPEPVPAELSLLEGRASYCRALENFVSVLNGELDVLVEVKDANGNYQELNAEERQQEARAIRKEYKSACL